MVIGQLGPSWWGGETDPVGDYEKTGQGNWDSPGAVDHNKLLADARLIISEAERSSAADGLDRIVIFEGFMLFYVRSDAALPTIISLTHEHQTRDASLISRIFAQDPLLVNLFDFQIWLELTYEVAVARRMATTPMPQSHYDNALWPNYCGAYVHAISLWTKNETQSISHHFLFACLDDSLQRRVSVCELQDTHDRWDVAQTSCARLCHRDAHSPWSNNSTCFFNTTVKALMHRPRTAENMLRIGLDQFEVFNHMADVSSLT